MKTKKRNPQDATMRNVKSVNKRLAEIEQNMHVLVALINIHSKHLNYIMFGAATAKTSSKKKK